METYQLILIGLGAFLAITTLIGGSKDDDEQKDVKSDDDHIKDHSLICIVEKWSLLRECCVENELIEACKKLDEAFPLLAPKNKPKKEIVDAKGKL